MLNWQESLAVSERLVNRERIVATRSGTTRITRNLTSEPGGRPIHSEELLTPRESFSRKCKSILQNLDLPGLEYFCDAHRGRFSRNVTVSESVKLSVKSVNVDSAFNKQNPIWCSQDDHLLCTVTWRSIWFDVMCIQTFTLCRSVTLGAHSHLTNSLTLDIIV